MPLWYEKLVDAIREESWSDTRRNQSWYEKQDNVLREVIREEGKCLAHVKNSFSHELHSFSHGISSYSLLSLKSFRFSQLRDSQLHSTIHPLWYEKTVDAIGEDALVDALREECWCDTRWNQTWYEKKVDALREEGWFSLTTYKYCRIASGVNRRFDNAPWSCSSCARLKVAFGLAMVQNYIYLLFHFGRK